MVLSSLSVAGNNLRAPNQYALGRNRCKGAINGFTGGDYIHPGSQWLQIKNRTKKLKGYMHK